MTDLITISLMFKPEELENEAILRWVKAGDGVLCVIGVTALSAMVMAALDQYSTLHIPHFDANKDPWKDHLRLCTESLIETMKNEKRLEKGLQIVAKQAKEGKPFRNPLDEEENP